MVSLFVLATALHGPCGPGIQCEYHWKSQLRGSPLGILFIIVSTAFSYNFSIALPSGDVAL